MYTMSVSSRRLGAPGRNRPCDTRFRKTIAPLAGSGLPVVDRGIGQEPQGAAMAKNGDLRLMAGSILHNLADEASGNENDAGHKPGPSVEMLVASSCRGGAPTRRSRAPAVLVGHEEQHEPRSRRCTERTIPDGRPSCQEDRETADQKDGGGAEHQDSERGDNTHGDPRQEPPGAPTMYLARSRDRTGHTGLLWGAMRTP